MKNLSFGFATLLPLSRGPEFDMPGHVTGWMAAYPKLGAGNGHYFITRGNGIVADLMDPTRESTYRFLDALVGEMTKLFPDESFHIGCDEVDPKQWNGNPRIQAFVKSHGIANGKALQTYFNQRLLKTVPTTPQVASTEAPG